MAKSSGHRTRSEPNSKVLKSANIEELVKERLFEHRSSSSAFDRTGFSLLTTIKDMVDFIRRDASILEVLEQLASELLEHCAVRSLKGSKNSQLVRKSNHLGLKLTKQRNHQSALIQFNIAVSHAHHETTELSNCLQLRASTFFGLERFTDCLYDLDYAIKTGLPAEQLTDCLPLRIKCLGHLRQFDKLRSELVAIDNLLIAFPKNSQFKELHRLCEKFLINETICKSSSIITDKSWVKMGATFMDIEFSDNLLIAGAHRAISLDCDPIKGKMLIANEQIEVNCDLIKDDVIVSTINEDNYANRCYNCLIAISERFFPCSNCTKVRFCSIDCQQSNLKSTHRFECEFLELFSNFPIGHLVLKLLIVRESESQSVNCDENSGWWNWIYKSLFTNSTSNSSDSSNVHSRTFASFERLKPTMPINFESKLLTTINSVLITKLVKRILITIKEDEVNLNYLVMKLMLIADCCKLTLPDHDFNSVNTQLTKSVNCNYGLGLFCTFSLINHSCDPNCKFLVHANCVCVTAIKTIKPGDEITISYGDFSELDLVSRRQLLNDNFGFNCNCTRCAKESVDCN